VEMVLLPSIVLSCLGDSDCDTADGYSCHDTDGDFGVCAYGQKVTHV